MQNFRSVSEDALLTGIDQDAVESYQNTQNYVTTLFDSLPRIQLSSTENKGKNLIAKLIDQNQQYGKKIIQLSQKFTSFYRKDHIFEKKDVQEKIKQIYQIVVDEQIPLSLQVDEMLSIVVKKLKSDSYSMLKAGYQHLQQSQGRSSQIQNILANKMVESKLQIKNMGQFSMKQSKTVFPNENLRLEGLNPNGQNLAESVAVSRKESVQSKSKVGRKTTTKKTEKNILEQEEVPLKKILKIKALMEEEETTIKQIYSQINNKIKQLKISRLNISQQKFTYNKIQDQTNRQNLQSLLSASTSNHNVNLRNLSQLLDMIFSDFDRKIMQQMQSQSKFTLYVKQIQKREEVYSYAVSKLIGHVNSLKNSFSQQNYRECMSIVEDLIGIGTKFYQLYPSSNVIKDLKVNPKKRQFQNQTQANYAVQVNTIKSTGLLSSSSTTKNGSMHSQSHRQSASFQLEMFKFQTKLTEVFDKFQKGQMKFKKSVQIKEIAKLINSIKELVPERTKTSLTPAQMQEVTKFEEEYKQLVTSYESREQKMIEDHQKKERKLDKHVKELEQTIESLKQQTEKEVQLRNDEIKKLTRKLENVQEKCKLAQKKNEDSQKIVKLVQQEIQNIKKKYREEQLQYQHKFQLQQQKIAALLSETGQKESRLHEVSSKQQFQKSQFEAQVMLYKKKIVLLEDKNITLTKDNQHLQNRIESLTGSAELSRQNLAEMTEVYEQKIKQVDQMIQNIQEMKHELEKKNERITELEEDNERLNAISSQFELQLEKQLQTIAGLKEDLQTARQAGQKALEVGQLNEADVQKLKEEMIKVHSAYVQSEEELQNLRELYEQLQHETNKVEEENRKLTTKLQEMKFTQNTYKNLEKNHTELNETITVLQAQNQELSSKCKQLQNQIYLVKKETKKLKQEELEQSKELRDLRQEVQKHKEEESLIKGKNKIELQSLKIQLRKKTEQNSKMKEMYEEKMEILSSKYKELQKFVTQKELLAKISNNHSTQ